MNKTLSKVAKAYREANRVTTDAAASRPKLREAMQRMAAAGKEKTAEYKAAYKVYHGIGHGPGGASEAAHAEALSAITYRGVGKDAASVDVIDAFIADAAAPTGALYVTNRGGYGYSGDMTPTPAQVKAAREVELYNAAIRAGRTPAEALALSEGRALPKAPVKTDRERYGMKMGNKVTRGLLGLRDAFPTVDDDDPCWAGFEQVGTKEKNGETVPNCVPTEDDWSPEAREAAKKARREFVANTAKEVSHGYAHGKKVVANLEPTRDAWTVASVVVR